MDNNLDDKVGQEAEEFSEKTLWQLIWRRNNKLAKGGWYLKPSVEDTIKVLGSSEAELKEWYYQLLQEEKEGKWDA